MLVLAFVNVGQGIAIRFELVLAVVNKGRGSVELNSSVLGLAVVNVGQG